MTLKLVFGVIFVTFIWDALCEEYFQNDDHSNQLLTHLTDSEKLFLFGAKPHKAQFDILHYKHNRRHKRDLHDKHDDVEILRKHLNVKQESKHGLLDSHFVLLRRWANSTEADLGNNNEELEKCYYKSEQAALFACGDIRGIVKSNDSYYFIHPLPERFHLDNSKPHIIVKRPIVDLHLVNQVDDEEEPTCVERLSENFGPSPSKQWTKHRRKRHIDTERIPLNNLEEFKLDLAHRNKTIGAFIAKLSIDGKRKKRAILPAVFVETAVFVDRDLYKHMTVNFPKDTERELVRFVLAMINAVQLLYHDPSLGRPVNFILKRLEILHEDPVNLKRPHDIDRFLSNFCTWQRLENPPGDSDPLHWDHALILTGLDLYVVNKNGKVSSQVVGLAPVAGMCTVTSSCTVNEGRHFESVYVVAHEIGHNLGMRHDGPLADNGCDPSAFVMSPTLGSGKITWSRCSRNYLHKFLDTSQSRCLLDHGSSAGQLDHSAEGLLPGERFDADHQCMLKYGRGSKHAAAQNLEDICRDLHCHRDRYTWTSHPALEGTKCGDDMYCRGGECVFRAGSGRAASSAAWGAWSPWSECASACLLDDRLAPRAAGLRAASRRCHSARHENNHCAGHDRKYQSCHAQQCDNVPRMTVREFADQICRRARDVDPDLIGTGLQRIDADDAAGACAVWCDRRGGGYKSRGWALPDGTACSDHAPRFCISGVCQKFTCTSDTDTEFSLRSDDCEWKALQPLAESTHVVHSKSSPPRRRAAGSAGSAGLAGSGSGSGWSPRGGCVSRCVRGGAGLRLVAGARGEHTIQLCAAQACAQEKTPYQYATMVCTKYKDKVSRLSGLGMQISPSLEDVDRACRVACQDAAAAQRFYLVSGADGWLPLGTRCGTGGREHYCVSGKCLEFGPDKTPLSESTFTLPLLPRSTDRSSRRSSRHRRSALRDSTYDGTENITASIDNVTTNITDGSDSSVPVDSIDRSSRDRLGRSLIRDRMTVKATLDDEHLQQIIAFLNLTAIEHDESVSATIPDNIEVDFNNPIHVAPADTLVRKPPRPAWD